jgi:hypothetical protein
MDKGRHLIENFFCKLKEFKRIALRADKIDQSFEAMIHLAAAIINWTCAALGKHRIISMEAAVWRPRHNC